MCESDTRSVSLTPIAVKKAQTTERPSTNCCQSGGPYGEYSVSVNGYCCWSLVPGSTPLSIMFSHSKWTRIFLLRWPPCADNPQGLSMTPPHSQGDDQHLWGVANQCGALLVRPGHAEDPVGLLSGMSSAHLSKWLAHLRLINLKRHIDFLAGGCWRTKNQVKNF